MMPTGSDGIPPAITAIVLKLWARAKCLCPVALFLISTTRVVGGRLAIVAEGRALREAVERVPLTV